MYAKLKIFSDSC